MIIFENRTTAIDTTPVEVIDDTTYQITVTGEFDGANVDVMVSIESLRPLSVKTLHEPGEVVLNVKAGTSWYLSVTDVGPDTDIDAGYL